MKNIKNNLIFFGLALFIFVAFGSMPKNANAYYYVGFSPSGNYIGCETDLDSNGNFVGCGNVNNNNNNWKDIGNSINGNPIPSIFSISPKSTKPNTSVTITVKGTNFIPSSVIRFNNSNQPTTYINSETLKFQVNSSLISNTGIFPIVVTSPGPGGGISNAISLNVNNNQNFTGTTNTNGTNTNGTNSADNNLNSSDLSANALFASNGFMPSGFLGWVLVFFLILVIVIIWRKLFATDKYNRAPLKHA